MSIKSHILDDLRIHVFIQSSRNGTMFHKQVLLHGRRGYLHMKRLVFYENVSCVSADAFAHHFCPRLYEAILVVGRLDAIQTHKLLNDLANLFGVPFPHTACL